MFLPKLLRAARATPGLEIVATDVDPVHADFAHLVPDFDIVLAHAVGPATAWADRDLLAVPPARRAARRRAAGRPSAGRPRGGDGGRDRRRALDRRARRLPVRAAAARDRARRRHRPHDRAAVLRHPRHGVAGRRGRGARGPAALHLGRRGVRRGAAAARAAGADAAHRRAAAAGDRGAPEHPGRPGRAAVDRGRTSADGRIRSPRRRTRSSSGRGARAATTTGSGSGLGLRLAATGLRRLEQRVADDPTRVVLARVELAPLLLVEVGPQLLADPVLRLVEHAARRAHEPARAGRRSPGSLSGPTRNSARTAMTSSFVGSIGASVDHQTVGTASPGP